MKKYKAFTLIEVMIVLTIIGILMTALAPLAIGYLNTAKTVKIKKNLQEVQKSINASIINYVDLNKNSFPIPNDSGDVSQPFNFFGNYSYSNNKTEYYLNLLLDMEDFFPEDSMLAIRDSINNSSSGKLVNDVSFTYEAKSTTRNGDYLGVNEYSSDFTNASMVKIESDGIYYGIYYGYTDFDVDTYSLVFIYDKSTGGLKHTVLANEGYIMIDEQEPIPHPSIIN